MKKIGILGSGIVARTLAEGFLKHGHQMVLGTRDPAKLKDWNAAYPAARIDSFHGAAAYGELLVLAVQGRAAMDVLNLAGAENIAHKVVIDTTNPIAEGPHDKGVIRYTTSLDSSLMEQFQKAFPNARFVKAFNSIGNAYMVNPDFGGEKPTMFICGNDAGAKESVTTILTKFGFETEDMGGVEGARAIEPLCILWCIPGFLRNQWSHAFRLLKK